MLFFVNTFFPPAVLSSFRFRRCGVCGDDIFFPLRSVLCGVGDVFQWRLGDDCITFVAWGEKGGRKSSNATTNQREMGKNEEGKKSGSRRNFKIRQIKN